MNYTITGQLVTANAPQSLGQLVVEAFYRLEGQVVQTAKTRTNTTGDFRLQFSDSLVANSTARKPAEVFFQIYQDKQLIPSRGGIERLQAKDYKIKIVLEDEAPTITGQVVDAQSQRPLPNLVVAASYQLRKNGVRLELFSFEGDDDSRISS